MNTQIAQLKVNLPLPLQTKLKAQAEKFGMTMAAYVKNLILVDIKSVDYPVKQASARTEAAYQRAKQEQKEGKLIRVDDVDEFFKQL
jgi:predicted DNA-binding protein